MKNNKIIIKNVDLYYSSLAFKERTLKKYLVDIFNFQKKEEDVHDIHALKNISVEINSGERVGLLGHNGAGKTTFLKMLAGLYPINQGERTINGSIRSLFDIGLGFEPDASGRENILYRGLLLGLSPQFMRRIEGEIVEFADIGEFIDYPIKTYSAGMQVRLAFAISTAVGGDILLLDEVIGAGDANFMQKTKKRISSLIEQSEVVILASHDFNSLKSICNRGLLFHHGSLIFDGYIDQAILKYKEINSLS